MKIYERAYIFSYPLDRVAIYGNTTNQLRLLAPTRLRYVSLRRMEWRSEQHGRRRSLAGDG